MNYRSYRRQFSYFGVALALIIAVVLSTTGSLLPAAVVALASGFTLFLILKEGISRSTILSTLIGFSAVAILGVVLSLLSPLGGALGNLSGSLAPALGFAALSLGLAFAWVETDGKKSPSAWLTALVTFVSALALLGSVYVAGNVTEDITTTSRIFSVSSVKEDSGKYSIAYIDGDEQKRIEVSSSELEGIENGDQIMQANQITISQSCSGGELSGDRCERSVISVTP